MYTPTPGTLHPTPGTYPPAEPESSPSRGLHLAIIAFAATLVIALGIGSYFMFFAKSDQGAAIADTTGMEDAGVTDTDQDIDTEPLDTTAPDSKTETTQEAGNVAGTGTDTTPDSDEATEVAKEPEMVTVQVVTKPKGAAVFLGDDEEPRGTTPLSFELEKGDAEMTLIIKRRRYKTETRTFTPDKNKEFDLSLNRVRRTSRRTGKSGGKSGNDKNDKIDKDVGLMAPDFD